MSYSSNTATALATTSNKGRRNPVFEKCLKKGKGFYGSLYMSDSDDEHDNSSSNKKVLLSKKKEDFPLLTAAVTKKKLVENPQFKISYAEKLKTPIKVEQNVCQYKITVIPNSYSIMTNVAVESEIKKCDSHYVKDLSVKKSWASYDSDSDDEDW